MAASLALKESGEAEALSELVEHKFGESPVELILAAPLTQDVVFKSLCNAHDLADMNARPNVWVFRRAVQKVCAASPKGLTPESVTEAWESLNRGAPRRSLGKKAVSRIKRMHNEKELCSEAAAFGQACFDLPNCLLTVAFLDDAPTYIGSQMVAGVGLPAALTRMSKNAQILTFSTIKPHA